jgi:hypothetical protein
MDKPVTLASLENRVVYVSGPSDTTDAEYAEARTWLRAHGARHVTTANRLVDDSLDDDQRLRERIHELTKRDYDAKEGALVRRPWYDVVVLMDGWDTSRESDIECRIALACGITVFELMELRYEADKLEDSDDES